MLGIIDLLNLDDVAIRVSAVGRANGAAEVWWLTVEHHAVAA